MVRFIAVLPCLLLFLCTRLAAAQEGAEQEFDPYVFKNVVLPFKNRNYARDWFGADIAFIQSPLAAPAKQLRESTPVKLPTIKPLIVSWKNLGDTRVNQENTWNFEKRVDSKVWWPNK
ncbi:hypothetical protein QR680_002399 [Steinernema hermaphroditum]|uniref:Uncharacterized protein n=1 Tax=Steinernema hermaphroditum TaxID=289476 RepID=A0AA39LI19_9BILA|nr:hypothetical protein QR680_002399 [Steinernema hermaphroditum]